MTTPIEATTRPVPIPLDLDVSFKLTLDTEIGRVNYKQIGPDEYDDGQPYTLLDALLDRMARMGVKQLIKDSEDWRSRRDNVHKTISELLREKLEPMIDETINGIVRPTDEFGEPTAPATTFRKQVVSMMRDQLRPKQGLSFSSGTSAFDEAVKAVAKDVITKELRTEIDAAKATIRAAAQEAAAAAIAKATTS